MDSSTNCQDVELAEAALPILLKRAFFKCGVVIVAHVVYADNAVARRVFEQSHAKVRADEVCCTRN